tara:strand:+ start:512 stop:1468 length:957 start_codon:yes stop_codon:yes gene_type:complete
MTEKNTYELASWNKAMLDFNEARAELEIAVDRSGVLAWAEAVKVASRPNSGLRVRYNGATPEFVPAEDSMPAVEAPKSLYSWVVPEAPEGLDKLTDYEAVEAERKVHAGGSETTKRAQAVASMIGVEHDRLTGYVVSLMRRVPQLNRWNYRQDLEQAIWTHLTHRKASIVGSWGLAKLECQVAYKRWYSQYADEAQLAVEAERRAISLERAYARDQEAESDQVGADVVDNDWLGWETALAGNIDATRLFASLPEYIRDMVEMKANGAPQNAKERKRLSRWLKGGTKKRNPNAQTNKDIIGAVLAGTHVGPIAWHKPIR